MTNSDKLPTKNNHESSNKNYSSLKIKSNSIGNIDETQLYQLKYINIESLKRTSIKPKRHRQLTNDSKVKSKSLVNHFKSSSTCDLITECFNSDLSNGGIRLNNKSNKTCIDNNNFAHQNLKYRNKRNFRLTSKQIRAIKTPMHKLRMNNCDQTRPSSVDVHIEISPFFELNRSAEFQQVHYLSNTGIIKQSRSNSLCESPFMALLSPDFYSHPISIDSIDTEGQIWNNPKQNWDEPIHMTLEEVRKIAFGSPIKRANIHFNSSNVNIEKTSSFHTITKILPSCLSKASSSSTNNGLQNAKTKIKNIIDNFLNKTYCIGMSSANSNADIINQDLNIDQNPIESRSPVLNHIRDIFFHHPEQNFNVKKPDRKACLTNKKADASSTFQNVEVYQNIQASPFIRRALPPLPVKMNNSTLNNIQTRRYQSLRRVSQSKYKSMTEYEKQKYLNYVSSIGKVKNFGWYWGPISGEMAEKLLELEPCGSFLVRDSSDEHYIFSLSFKLDGMVRHVRIEQEQGNFSFGSLKKFRSSTIVEFIESAMEHSRSGQFLFFLRLGPELGPIRVQLLHPVSRFKRVQSLQHICRFVILQYVRRDQIPELPLPEYLRHYLDTPYYYSEELAQMQRETGGQKKNEMKRKFFLKTDYHTLLDKMLINQNIWKKLSEQIIDNSSINEILTLNPKE